MQDKSIGLLRREFGPLCHDSINDLPDGWATIVGEFFHAVEGIGDLVEAVSCRFERTDSGLQAFVFPEMSRWHPEQMAALQAAQRTLYGQSQTTCETCGKEAIYPPGANGFFCTEHDIESVRNAEDLARVTEELEPILPYKALRRFSLDVPPHLRELVFGTLREIKEVVERENLVRHCHVMNVMVVDDQLYIRGRFRDSFPMSVRSDIDDLIRRAEWQSAEMARGGSDAS